MMTAVRRVQVGWSNVVNKLVRILTVIFVAFALSSLLVYKLRLGSTLHQSQRVRTRPNLVEETKTVEGQIQAIDPGTSTFTRSEERRVGKESKTECGREDEK